MGMARMATVKFCRVSLFFVRPFLDLFERELRKTESGKMSLFLKVLPNYVVFWEVDSSLSRDTFVFNQPLVHGHYEP